MFPDTRQSNALFEGSQTWLVCPSDKSGIKKTSIDNGRNVTDNGKRAQKPEPVPLCPPQIAHTTGLGPRQ